MKHTTIFRIAVKMLIIIPVFLFSCDDYLDKTPDADVTERDIFTTYESFQGFQDVLYSLLVDYNSHALTTGSENGDHTIALQGWSSARKYATGNYWEFFDRLHSNYYSNAEDNVLPESGSGIWIDGYRAIRIANICLANIDLLSDATAEQRDLITGQAHFFRAYMHWELVMRWGGIPYVDYVIQPTDDMRLPRPSFQETVERIVEDFDLAAELLPWDWDQTATGSRREGFNTGRATRGAALAFKAKALLYAGSPLMVADAGGGFTYDSDYMQRAAEAAWELLKEVEDNGIYELIHFDEIQRNFATNDGTIPWTDEWIWGKIETGSGSGQLTNRHGRLYSPGRFGGNDINETPVQNFVDMFEMKDTGLPIEDGDSGYDETDPWSNRDPRFRQFVYVDGDLAGFDPATKLTLYKGGTDKENVGTLTSYFVWKYWPKGVNNIDALWGQFRYATPHMRLADLYLIYAEAVNEAWGPDGSAPGASLTAVEAVNRVRQRPGLDMPPVHAKFTGNKDTFRDRIWNERSVELCFEGARWNDIRRWYIAHLPEYWSQSGNQLLYSKTQYDLEFDEGHTQFNRVVRFRRVFEQRHYWMPFPREQTQIYPEWPQNPGW
jgi:starch-binding outer membrane protein, SusD/RagB family